MMMLPGLESRLLDASRIAARLMREGLRVEQIRIHGRARPAVQIHPDPRSTLTGCRYAWGRDDRGGFQRYATDIDGVQVQWEVRHEDG